MTDAQTPVAPSTTKTAQPAGQSFCLPPCLLNADGSCVNLLGQPCVA